MKSHALLPTLLTLALLSPALAQDVTITAPQVSTESPAHRDARLKWFREARFGMFIHWGVYAVAAGEWQGKPVKWGGEWIERMGKIPVGEYKTLAKGFTATKYDPQAWAALARQAGMKYVVLTAKHHDGFALYDSAVTDWTALHSAAGRDLIVPLEKAVRDQGLKFGLYYSQAQDWSHPGGALYGLEEGNAKGWDPAAQMGSFDEYIKKIAVPQVREILTRFHPDVIWWDTPYNMNASRAALFDAVLKEQAPEIVSNNRLGGNYQGDTRTPEQNIPPRGFPGEMFEVCMTMNGTWGFKKDDLQWKSLREILQHLTDISSKGGNFLLNVGPTAEGEIPQASIERLQAIGRWMDINGAAIYGTDASPFPRRFDWGRVTRKTNADGTYTLYMHVWEWPSSGRILLPTLRNQPVSARLLAGAAAVSSELTPEGLQVVLPASAPDPDVSVVALNFAAAPEITQPGFMLPTPQGQLILNATDADTFGGLSGNLQRVIKGTESYLTHWTDITWHVAYPIKIAAPSRWKITAEIAVEKPVSLTITYSSKPTKETTLTAKIPATGGKWNRVELGSIELPAGEMDLDFKPVKQGWSSLDLRQVTLSRE